MAKTKAKTKAKITVCIDNQLETILWQSTLYTAYYEMTSLFGRLFNQTSGLKKLFERSIPLSPAILDDHRAYTRLRLNDYLSDGKTKVTQAMTDEVFDESSDLSNSARRAKIVNILNQRVQSMFADLHSCIASDDSVTFPLNKDSPIFKTDKIRNKIGFDLEVKESNIPNAGYGVFIRTSIPNTSILPGTVIAFYPGKVYLNEYVSTQKDIDKLLPDDHFMLMRRYMISLLLF